MDELNLSELKVWDKYTSSIDNDEVVVKWYIL